MFLRRVILQSNCKFNRPFSTAADILTESENFRSKNNPSDQKSNEIGLFYRIDPNVKKQLFSIGGLPKSFSKQVKTFGETCLMIRKPALEIIDYIRSSDLNRPTVRYVLYGENGVGKSLTLAHLIHYGHENDFVLVHVPWLPYWYKHPKEKASSERHEGYIDLPIDAAAWLIHFKNQNEDLLKKLELKCSKDYVWSKRETTPSGAPLLELVDHGIARIKFACDVIAGLLDELKLQSSQRKCKTMVAIDGYNAMFWPETHMHGETRAHKITTDQVTLTKPFIDITSYDWTNGVCILAVDKIALKPDSTQSSLPLYLVGKNGFEHLDPFVPVKVDNYTELEFDRCIEYYLNRRWICRKEEGFDDELKYLSGLNPYDLMLQCAPL